MVSTSDRTVGPKTATYHVGMTVRNELVCTSFSKSFDISCGA